MCLAKCSRFFKSLTILAKSYLLCCACRKDYDRSDFLTDCAFGVCCPHLHLWMKSRKNQAVQWIDLTRDCMIIFSRTPKHDNLPSFKNFSFSKGIGPGLALSWHLASQRSRFLATQYLYIKYTNSWLLPKEKFGRPLLLGVCKGGGSQYPKYPNFKWPISQYPNFIGPKSQYPNRLYLVAP